MGRRSSKAKRRRQIRMILYRIMAVEVCILLFMFLVYQLVAGGKIYKKVIIQAGMDITVDLFEKKEKYETEFVTDVSQIQTNGTGEYDIELKIKDKTYKSKLKIVDTLKPTAEAAPKTVYNGFPVEAKDLVTNIRDNTVVTAEFKEKYDFSTIGERDVVVVLTDLGENKIEIKTKVTIAKDTEAPIISGVKDITICIGDTIAYKKDVTVTDNLDTNVQLSIDSSMVNMKKPGTYPATYSATDAAGNTTTLQINVIVNEPEPGVYNEEIVNYLAGQVLETIVNDAMSDTEKIKAVYKWTKSNIGYINTSDKSDWIKGAYQGFTQKQGDCFIYYCVGKALLNALGVNNVDIVKSDTSHSSHYWSLVDIGSGYYHFDCTPRKGGGEFFMLTDEELAAYSTTHNNSHIFDENAYPARATEKFNLN